ncbi:MAG: PepSY domain-containing protein [Burkholderiaceae bacterium]
MRTSSLFAVIALAAGIAGAAALVPPAFADDRPGRSSWDRGGILTIGQIYEQLTAAGYTRIKEIELDDDDEYEVEAIDRRGRKVELEIDARTGRITDVDYDD